MMIRGWMGGKSESAPEHRVARAGRVCERAGAPVAPCHAEVGIRALAQEARGETIPCATRVEAVEPRAEDQLHKQYFRVILYCTITDILYYYVKYAYYTVLCFVHNYSIKSHKISLVNKHSQKTHLLIDNLSISYNIHIKFERGFSKKQFY